MKTKIVSMDNTNLNNDIIEEAGQIIKQGGLVAFPTETVYGLGADALQENAAARIYEAKGRPSDNPLIVHISNQESLAFLVREIPDKAKALAKCFWPGPLTMILYKSDTVPCATTGGLDTVAVRMPGHPISLALIQAGGGYIAAPSANVSGRPSPTKAEHVIDDLDGKIDMVIDGGEVGIGLESTIVDLTGDIPVILRPGYITREMMEPVIGEIHIDQNISEPAAQPKAPGMKYRHYAPKAPMVLVEGEALLVAEKIISCCAEAIQNGKMVGIIATDETKNSYPDGIIKSIGFRDNGEAIAHNLYAVLREFDKEEVDIIYAESVIEEGIGYAIRNRMRKAAGYHVLHVPEITDFRKYNRILFITGSGTGRASMAEAIMKSMKLVRPFEIESRGIVVLFPEPVNQKAETVMDIKGVKIKDQKSSPLTEEDFTKGTMMVVMETRQREKIIEEFGYFSDIFTLGELTDTDTDIPSPLGQPLRGYTECYDILEGLLQQLADKINNKEEDKTW